MKTCNSLPHWAMSYSNINEWEDRIIIIIGHRHHLCVHAYVYTYIKIWYTYIRIHKCIHTYTHTQTHMPSEKRGSPEGLKTILYTLLWYTLPNCVSMCMYMFNSVWRKMWEGREAWTWIWEKSFMLLSLFQICAWKHISKCLVHWLSLPTAKQEEIHNIKGALWKWKYLCMHFLFFPVVVLIHHIPDNWQDEKLKELIWFLPLTLFICFMFLPKLRENLGSPSPYGFLFISSNGLAHCKLAFSSGLIKSF